ncbi:hypothetical protein BDSB_24130 [Burkholderia dolosa PC543]|nr:hypothetical protein BDSB_24130 [Burkholderia dolosa PC543]
MKTGCAARSARAPHTRWSAGNRVAPRAAGGERAAAYAARVAPATITPASAASAAYIASTSAARRASTAR